MGKVVLKVLKEKEVGTHITAHIERQKTVTHEDGTTESVRFVPNSVRDESRMSLNKVLIGGDTPRSELVNARIQECGVKVRADQVRAHLVVMTGTHEDMSALEEDGRLDEWCNDAIALAQRMYGKENVVQAVLHMDEKTPHIHFTCVPLLQGVTKHKKSQETAKKGGRKAKSATEWRLCSKEVFCPQNARMWQTWAGETMKKYGLDRGEVVENPQQGKTTSEWIEQELEHIQSVQTEVKVAEQKRDFIYEERDKALVELNEERKETANLRKERYSLEKEKNDLQKRITEQLEQDKNELDKREAEIKAIKGQIKAHQRDLEHLTTEIDGTSAFVLKSENEAMIKHIAPIARQEKWAISLKEIFQEVSNRTIAQLWSGLSSIVSGVFRLNNEEIEIKNVELNRWDGYVVAKDVGEEYSSSLSDYVGSKLESRNREVKQDQKREQIKQQIKTKQTTWGGWGKKRGMGI